MTTPANDAAAYAANDPNAPVVLTVSELAALLRLKPKSVYAMLAGNPKTIPGCRKIGGAWRAHRETVVAWLAGQNSDVRPKGAR